MSENKLKPTSTVKKTTKKATNAEIIQRLSEIKSLLLQGQTRSTILRYAQKWNLVDNQIDRYISEATKEIQEIVQQETTTDISILIANLWDIVNTNKATNPQVARQALMDIAKLRGMDQTTVNHTFKRNDDLAKLSEDDFDKIMAQAAQERH